MALPLLAIGEMFLQGQPGNVRPLPGKGLLNDLSFGSMLQQKLGQLGTDGSVLSQIAGMLQGGTPLVTVIDRIAGALSNALTSASGNDGNASRQSTLQRALASALAPPGTSPPMQSGIQQAAALESRLSSILSGISGVLQNAGQQNRFSGQVLDAKSAREIPAQQQTNPTAGIMVPGGGVPSAQSILQNAVQQLQSAAQQSAPQIPPGIPQITTQSADILGRMLARAAAAAAQQSDPGTADQSQTAVQTQQAAVSPVAPPTATPSASELFARLMNVIAQSSGQDASQNGGKQSQEFAFSKDSAPAASKLQSPSGTASTPAFSTAITAASAPAAQPSSVPVAPYVDPQSVIEQVVQGIVLRNSGSTSELRMRLQPEHLGDVSLKLTVNGNTISASIVAQNADVRSALLSNQQQLARSLAEAGLSLGTFSVDVSGGNPGFSQQQSAQQRSLSKAGGVRASVIAEDDTWADQRYGPPVLTGAKSLVLNYLA